MIDNERDLIWIVNLNILIMCFELVSMNGTY